MSSLTSHYLKLSVSPCRPLSVCKHEVVDIQLRSSVNRVMVIDR